MTREEWKNHVTIDHIEEVLYYVECLMDDYELDKRTDLKYDDLEELRVSLNILGKDIEKRIKKEYRV